MLYRKSVEVICRLLYPMKELIQNKRTCLFQSFQPKFVAIHNMFVEEILDIDIRNIKMSNLSVNKAMQRIATLLLI